MKYFKGSQQSFFLMCYAVKMLELSGSLGMRNRQEEQIDEEEKR